jgi:hypothetical protein
MNFGVLSITNPTERTFVHSYDGQEIEIKAGATVQLPENVARDVAYHLSQRILSAKGIGFFGSEHEECIEELLGNKEPTHFGSAKEEISEAPAEDSSESDEITEAPAEDSSESDEITEAPAEDSSESDEITEEPKKQAPRGFMKKKTA